MNTYNFYLYNFFVRPLVWPRADVVVVIILAPVADIVVLVLAPVFRHGSGFFTEHAISTVLARPSTKLPAILSEVAYFGHQRAKRQNWKGVGGSGKLRLG